MTGETGADAGAPLTPFFLVFVGCVLSMVFIEYVLQGDSKAGNLINATEFVFVLVQSIPGRMTGGGKFKPFRAAWSSHFTHALLWVLMSTFANYVFAFNIRVPIHTLFRSCNVIASVILGLLFFGQRYTIRQFCCVVVITVGVFLAGIGDSKKFFASTCVDCGAAPTPAADAEADAAFWIWVTGICMLVGVQLLQATLGHTQATFYKRFSDRGSKDQLADEYMFTAHIAALLMILALWDDIMTAGRLAIDTPYVAPWLPIPQRVAWMILNNFTQLMCIKGVFRLSANYSPLTVNVTLSVRKFGSVVISAWWFGNPWTSLHSLATLVIFGGVFAYSQSPKAAELEPAKEKEKKSE